MATGSEVRFVGTIPNEPTAIARLMRKLGKEHKLHVCYEAGPTGYVLYWQLAVVEYLCVVIAPSLVPTKSGDRVKTDRRDAEKLAWCYRSGDLTPVWVPSKEHEACATWCEREKRAKKDQPPGAQSRAEARQGIRSSMREWTETHRTWLMRLTFDYEAQQATFTDYLTEIDHVGTRIESLDKAMDAAVVKAPENMRKVIEALQSLRGVPRSRGDDHRRRGGPALEVRAPT